MTFSIVLPAERVRVSPALTTCAAALPRLTVTARVVVAEKSSVSTPPPDSLIVSLPRAVVGVEAEGVVAGPAGQHVVAAAPLERVVAGPASIATDVVQGVAGEGVAQGPADDVLDRVAGREGQGQPRVDHLRRRVAEVDGHGAGGGGREVEGVDPAAGLVDRVAAQGVVGVEAEGVVAGPAGQRVVAAAPRRSALFRALPVMVSPRAPPMTFSIVSTPRDRVSPALTTCCVPLMAPRSMLTARVVVAEKSSVSTPLPGSRSVELVDRVAAQGVVGVEAEGVVAGPAGQHVVAAATLDHVVQGVARDRVAQGTADDVLDRVAGREGQGQPGVDHLRRRVAEVDAHGAGGGGREGDCVNVAKVDGSRRGWWWPRSRVCQPRRQTRR